MAVRHSAWIVAGRIRGGGSRQRLRLRRLAAVLAVVGVTTTMLDGIASPAQATTAGPGVGAVADITWGTSQADINNTISSMTAAGIKWVRAGVSWAAGEEHGKGVWNQGYLSQMDYAVGQARAAGMEVLMPIADGVPYWASADPAKYADASGHHWNKYWRPANASDFGDFMRAMVNRYKGFGVRTYEVWNEPNLSRFWPSGPNAVEFTALLAAAYPAVKAADPAATVLMGGLSKGDYNYLAQVYAAGGRPYFDAVAVHPYTGSVDPTWCWNQAGTTRLAIDAFCSIEEVRNTMVANGDSAKTMWLTEFGWSTNSGSYGVTEAVQADFLTKALDRVRSSYPYVVASFWYNFRNNYWLNNAADDYEANLGLLRIDFSAKPSYDAMRLFTGAPLAPPTTTTTVAPTTTTTVAPTTTTTTAPPTTTVVPTTTTDIQAPVVSNVAAEGITRSSATITWTTNEASSSVVDFGIAGLTTSVTGTGGVTSHTVALSGLARSTRYIYRVRSVDGAGNAGVSVTYSFTTAKK